MACRTKWLCGPHTARGPDVPTPVLEQWYICYHTYLPALWRHHQLCCKSTSGDLSQSFLPHYQEAESFLPLANRLAPCFWRLSHSVLQQWKSFLQPLNVGSLVGLILTTGIVSLVCSCFTPVPCFSTAILCAQANSPFLIVSYSQLPASLLKVSSLCCRNPWLPGCECVRCFFNQLSHYSMMDFKSFRVAAFHR